MPVMIWGRENISGSRPVFSSDICFMHRATQQSENKLYKIHIPVLYGRLYHILFNVLQNGFRPML